MHLWLREVLGESDRRSPAGTSLAAETAFFATSTILSLAKHLLSTSCDTVSVELATRWPNHLFLNRVGGDRLRRHVPASLFASAAVARAVLGSTQA